MSVTSGFFDSLSNDRRYSSLQFSSLFDGLINDGIFSTVGNAFAVTKAVGAENERTITVDTGRAWFNHTWTLNDALLPLVGDEAELLLDRIDAVILDIDSREEVRNNSIKIVKGTPASNPVRPTLISSQYRNQYALAYIRRPNKQSRGTEGDTIRSSDITSVIGSTDTPFVTGILQTLSINTLLTQYDEEVNELIAMLRRNIEDASSGGVLEGSVTTEKIAQEAVTGDKIAANAVSTTYTASITTGWSGSSAPYSREVTVNGITANDTPIIDLVPSSTYETAEQQIEAWGYVYHAVTTENKITFYATEKPTVALPIQIKAVRK